MRKVRIVVNKKTPCARSFEWQVMLSILFFGLQKIGCKCFD